MAVLIPVVEIKNWSSIKEPIRSDVLDASPAPGAPQTPVVLRGPAGDAGSPRCGAHPRCEAVPSVDAKDGF